MSATRLSDEDARALTLGSDSVSWRYVSDVRMYLIAGYALMHQVAHPTIGSGVRDHSEFRRDPWGRLLRTTDFVNLLIYGGEDAVEVGRRLRDLHKRIKGVNPDGSRYHALEPEAFAWVHVTLMEAVMRGVERFVGPLAPGEHERMYQEWLGLGRLLGVRERDLPPDWAGFRVYFDEMLATRLSRNETVDSLLDVIGQTPRPPVLPPAAEGAWKLARMPSAHVLQLTTVGLLRPSTRALLGLNWSARQEAELQALGLALRALTPVMPQRLRVTGPVQLRMRARAIRRHEFAPDGPLPAGASAPRLAAAA